MTTFYPSKKLGNPKAPCLELNEYNTYWILSWLKIDHTKSLVGEIPFDSLSDALGVIQYLSAQAVPKMKAWLGVLQKVVSHAIETKDTVSFG